MSVCLSMFVCVCLCCVSVCAHMYVCHTYSIPLVQNCSLVFRKLPLHLWTPTSKDMEVIREWLIDFPLKSHENALAMLILENMNWGTKNEAELALDYSLHKMIALLLVEAHSRHLPTHPGGVEYNSGLNPELSLSKVM